MTTAPAHSERALLTRQNWAGGAEQDHPSGRKGVFMEQKQDLARPSVVVYSRALLSLLNLSPLKNSPHFSPAKAKQTGHGKGFYFYIQSTAKREKQQTGMKAR